MRTAILVIVIFSLISPLSAQQDPGGEAKIVRRDGTTVTGRVEKVTIKSASLGEVTIEGAKIDKIALAAFRPFDDTARKKAEALIPEIGDDDPAKREAATEKIRGMGPGVLTLLKAHLTTDPDTKFRINGIIEALKAIKGRSCDTVEGEDFFLDGTITSLIVDGKPLDLREVKSISINASSDSGDVVGAWTLDVDATINEIRKPGREQTKYLENVFTTMEVTIDIRADNTFTGAMKNSIMSGTVKGTWNLEGENLIITTTEEDGKPKDPPEIQNLTFKEGVLFQEESGIRIILKRK